LTPQDAIRLQREIAKKVIAKDDFGSINQICGVDVAYDGDDAYCSAVVMEGGSVIESPELKTTVKHPYVPGLLTLREAKPVLRALAMLKGYDLLLVDGHGLLHPRKSGIACYLGVTLDKPAVGVAKSRLCGTVRPDGFVEMAGEILGYAISEKCTSAWDIR
jgi:deoxyribonuclease V